MPLQNTDIEGTLTIGAIAMDNVYGAWGICGDAKGVGGLVHLWTKFDVRGEDRILPTVTGVIPYPRRMTATRCDLRLLVVGDIDGQTGAIATNPIETFADNLAYLEANVLAPVTSSTGLRAAILTVPGQTNRTANIHVLGMTCQSYQLDMCAAIGVYTLHISIPQGRFS